MLLRLFVVLFIVSFTVSCSPTFTEQIEDDERALAAFALVDLRMAQKNATARGDVVASTCYAHLVTIAEARAAAIEFSVVGPVSAFDKVRAARRKFDEGLTDQTRLACSALFAETKMTVARIAKLLAIPLP